MRFWKYHGLGNDYIIINPADCPKGLTEEQIKTICHRNYGVGSDGILYGPSKISQVEFDLRIFNPDGSEAEKSGNGLRIFARYLWDQKLVGFTSFLVQTAGGKVKCLVHHGAEQITVEMGQVSFSSEKIPVKGENREVLQESITLPDQTFTFSAATIGNPHCVILKEEISEKEARKYGPLLETEDRFPNRTNVQFMKILDRNNIRIEIWERGAGYTLASGSSSSAAAAVAHRLGHCDDQITVHMPGGQLAISILPEYHILMRGPVQKICSGIIDKEFF
jgi:diaminopimelate epimerase